VDVCLRLSIPAWMTRQEEEEDGALASLSDYLSVTLLYIIILRYY
jgi:hypothetical protein